MCLFRKLICFLKRLKFRNGSNKVQELSLGTRGERKKIQTEKQRNLTGENNHMGDFSFLFKVKAQGLRHIRLITDTLLLFEFRVLEF
jgi:hypothetical protein